MNNNIVKCRFRWRWLMYLFVTCLTMYVLIYVFLSCGGYYSNELRVKRSISTQFHGMRWNFYRDWKPLYDDWPQDYKTYAQVLFAPMRELDVRFFHTPVETYGEPKETLKEKGSGDR